MKLKTGDLELDLETGNANIKGAVAISASCFGHGNAVTLGSNIEEGSDELIGGFNN
tara:strand:+ start:44 stop:211 length:168 start_codon:yes stop_codon:yes gene_type:complete